MQQMLEKFVVAQMDILEGELAQLLVGQSWNLFINYVANKIMHDHTRRGGLRHVTTKLFTSLQYSFRDM